MIQGHLSYTRISTTLTDTTRDASCATVIATGEQRVFAAEADRADGAFHGVGVGLDAAVVEETDQAAVVVQRVSDRLRGRAAAGQPR